MTAHLCFGGTRRDGLTGAGRRAGSGGSALPSISKSERNWLVPDQIPQGDVTGLHGDVKHGDSQPGAAIFKSEAYRLRAQRDHYVNRAKPVYLLLEIPLRLTPLDWL